MLQVRGARARNLRDVDVDLPLHRLVVLTGVSGSGKSSLAVQTLAAAGQRRLLESLPSTLCRPLDRLDTPDVDSITRIPPPVLVRSESLPRTPSATVATLLGLERPLAEFFLRGGTLQCPQCHGEVHGDTPEIILQRALAASSSHRVMVAYRLTAEQRRKGPAALVQQGCVRGFARGEVLDLTSLSKFPSRCEVFAIVDRLSLGKAPAERWEESLELAFREGAGECCILYEAATESAATGWQPLVCTRDPRCHSCELKFESPRVEDLLSEPSTDVASASDLVSLSGVPYRHALQLTLQEFQNWWRGLTNPKTEDDALPELGFAVGKRLETANDVGLGYLGLSRRGTTLSAGESRRLLLANAVASELAETLLIVEEPAAGLHPVEVPGLLRMLKRPLANGQSVLVVEHDPQVVAAADWIVELGPGAGSDGGRIVAQGTPQWVRASTASVTSRAWTALQQPAGPFSTRRIEDWIEIRNISGRTLREVSVRLPVGGLTVVTGVSGSGKTSLVMDAIPTVLSRHAQPDQSSTEFRWADVTSTADWACEPIQATPLTAAARSTVVTWLGAFDDIRQVFAETAEARRRGWSAAQFSYASSQGLRCPACRGRGRQHLELTMLTDVAMTCPECAGTRYRSEVLDVKYRGLTIADVLNLTIAEAQPVFRQRTQLHPKFAALTQLGLEYLVLGQPASELSTGEAQRVRLAAKLWSRPAAGVLFLCDEPTTGIHTVDVTRLARCCRQLANLGQTLILIDHHRELLEAADWIIELGPGAGPTGGQVVATGPPQELIQGTTSLTGQILRGE